MARLTDRLIGSLKVPPGKKDRIVFDDECRGLGVRVTVAGTRMFIVQWHDRGAQRKRREPLGTWGSLTIAQAREAARALLGGVARGIDPANERKRQKQQADAERAEAALTLDALITKWAKCHLSTKRPKYRREAERALRYAFAKHLKRPAAHLARAEVRTVLDGLVERGSGLMALRTAAYGRAAFGWAIGQDEIANNPFSNLKLSVEEQDRDRVLTDGELIEIWEAAGQFGYPFGDWTRFAMLTLQRGREECAGLRRAEISPDRPLWTIPGARMKNKKPHDVHLTEPARELLRSIPAVEGQDLVFTSKGRTPISGFSKFKLALDARVIRNRAEAAKRANMKPTSLAPWRFHDFRRTGVTKLAEMGFDSIAVDKLLAHRPKRLKGTAAIYQRHEFMEERKRALEAWAAYLTRSSGATVLPFKAVRPDT